MNADLQMVYQKKKITILKVTVEIFECPKQLALS